MFFLVFNLVLRVIFYLICNLEVFFFNTCPLLWIWIPFFRFSIISLTLLTSGYQHYQLWWCLLSSIWGSFSILCSSKTVYWTKEASLLFATLSLQSYSNHFFHFYSFQYSSTSPYKLSCILSYDLLSSSKKNTLLFLFISLQNLKLIIRPSNMNVGDKLWRMKSMPLNRMVHGILLICLLESHQ